MHPRLVERALDHELELARNQVTLMERVTSMTREARTIVVKPRRIDAPLLLVFDGRNYDADPLGLTVVDETTGAVASTEMWPGNLSAGEHPSLKRPFACIRGLYEYHTHYSHLEPWDRWRYSLRFPLLLKHVLDKAGLQ
jgi:hypothetical protein